MSIHPSAIVDPQARLAEGVVIGPYCLIGPDVTIGAGTRLESHCTVKGRVSLGRGNYLHPHVVIGGEPQDISCQNTDTAVEIGDHNIFREGVTVNRGTEKEIGLTSVGSHCYFMTGCHIGHDCSIGDHVIMANSCHLSGHVHVQHHATISGVVGVHHFCTVGSYSFVGGVSRVIQDVPPFMLAEGVPTRARCINAVGLKRNHFSSEQMRSLSVAHKLLYRSKVGLDQSRELLRANGQLLPVVNHLLNFVESQQQGRNGRGRERIRKAA